MFWSKIVSWITGDLVGQLTKAYEAKLTADTDSKKLAAEIAIKNIESDIDARRAAKEIRLQTSNFWEMRLITFLIAGCFTLHLLAVTLDTVFGLGLGIAAFPKPFDEWQGAILLSFFGVYAGVNTVNVIASAIIGRRK